MGWGSTGQDSDTADIMAMHYEGMEFYEIVEAGNYDPEDVEHVLEQLDD